MAYKTTIIEGPDYTYIPGGLNIGCQIIVKGKFLHDDDRFDINFQNTEDEECDVAFHFNPRLDEKTVVRNSYQGDWQDPETDAPCFPFSRRSKFTIKISVGPDSFKVVVNGHHFIDFDHRLPYQDVRFMKLSEGAEYYEATVKNSCRVPYYGEFSGGLCMGKALRVRGQVNDDAESFAIDFNCDEDGENIGVHFNPRQDEEDVVLNACVDGWQEEERGQESFPFQKGQFFNVLFIAYDGQLNITVNDEYFTSFTFRVPPEDILFLHIHGDVCLMDVEFTDPLPDDYVQPFSSSLGKGDLIAVEGIFHPEGERFIINLLYGDCLDDDVALHFTPRRDEGEVVLNSRSKGRWGKEERHPLPQPFVDSIPFGVEMITEHNKFKIYVNGSKFGTFKVKGKIEEIQAVSTEGDAYIHEVEILGIVDTPFVDRLPAPFEPGSWVSIVGTPKKGADNFAINLQCGDDNDYGCDVAFHFNPRFNGEGCVRNTLEEDSWGEEEGEQPNFPFEPKEQFEIDILCLPDMYRVFVNYETYIDYAHRIVPGRVSHIMLTGDCDFFEPEFY